MSYSLKTLKIISENLYSFCFQNFDYMFQRWIPGKTLMFLHFETAFRRMYVSIYLFCMSNLI